MRYIYIWQPDRFRGHVKIHGSVIFVIAIYPTRWSCDVSADNVGLLQGRKADIVGRNVVRPTFVFAYLSPYTYLLMIIKTTELWIFTWPRKTVPSPYHDMPYLHSWYKWRKNVTRGFLYLHFWKNTSQPIARKVVLYMYINPKVHPIHALHIRLLW